VAKPHVTLGPALAMLAALGACRGAERGRVVVALPSAVATLAPNTSAEEFTVFALANVFEPLLADAPGVGLTPRLAASWHTPDELTWVFELREGILLHDGRTLTAEHVRRSLSHAKDDRESRRRAMLAAVDRIEARDARTLVLRTRRPFGALANRLAGVQVWAEPEVEGGLPVGTGPFRVRSWRPDGDLVLEAFPGYRGGSPPVPILEFRAVPDARRRVELLKQGRVHVLVDVSAADMKAFALLPGVRTATREGLRVVFLGLNCRSGPFADVRLRRAVALAIDRERLVRGPLEGYAQVVDQLVAPEVFGAAPALFGRPHDPEGARRLLAEAGRSGGFGATLDYVPGKYRAIEGVVAAIAADLRRVGIRVAPKPWAAEEFFGRLESGTSPLYVMGWSALSGDAALAYEYLVHTPGDGLGQANGSRYSNPEVDRLLDEVAVTTRTEERRALLNRVASQVQLDAPVLPLYRQADLYAVAADLEFAPRADRAIDGAALRWRAPR
jgi:peptide/nickel transport system substrate-binding protein